MTKQKLLMLIFFFGSLHLLAQEKDTSKTANDTQEVILVKKKKLTWIQRDSLRVQRQLIRDSIVKQKKNAKKAVRIAKREERRIKNIRPYNALAPSKAAFYSAVIPGLGQAYTGKYWKIPIVYGALGTSVGIALWNDSRLRETRDIFRRRLRGVLLEEDVNPNTGRVFFSEQALADGQRQFRKQKELSILFSIGIYVLNIVDANVTAHLQQYNLNENLSLIPKVNVNSNEYHLPEINYGLAIKYQF